MVLHIEDAFYKALIDACQLFGRLCQRDRASKRKKLPMDPPVGRGVIRAVGGESDGNGVPPGGLP